MLLVHTSVLQRARTIFRTPSAICTGRGPSPFTNFSSRIPNLSGAERNPIAHRRVDGEPYLAGMQKNTVAPPVVARMRARARIILGCDTELYGSLLRLRRAEGARKNAVYIPLSACPGGDDSMLLLHHDRDNVYRLLHLGSVSVLNDVVNMSSTSAGVVVAMLRSRRIRSEGRYAGDHIPRQRQWGL